MNLLIPVFPLELVVYPGEELNLHIFEPRYKQLIHDSVRTHSAFGIPSVVDRKLGGLGTLVDLLEISSVDANGEMDIKTKGSKIFRLTEMLNRMPGKLYSGARVEYLPDDDQEAAELMPPILAAIQQLHALLNVEKKFAKPDAELTSFDVAHHAGFSLAQEYELLGMFGERQRLNYLSQHLAALLPVVQQVETLKEKIKCNGHFKIVPGFDPDSQP